MANPQTAKSSFTQFMQQPTRYIFHYMYHLLQKKIYMLSTHNIYLSLTQHLFKSDIMYYVDYTVVHE